MKSPADFRLPLLLAVACMGLAVVAFGQGGQDDCYITYFPAWTLAKHGAILNYDGIRLEQSSSLSLVVVLAALFEVTRVSVPTLGFLTSLGSGVVALLLAVRLARTGGLAVRGEIVLVAGTVHCFGYWATSGMETPLYAAAGLWLSYELLRPTRSNPRSDLALIALAGAFFAGARPEAPLVAIGVCVLRFLQLGASLRFGTRRTRQECLLGAHRVGAALLGTVALVLFRRFYFHAWVPNPAAMKSGGFNVTEGTEYLWGSIVEEGFASFAFFAIGGLALCVRRFRGIESEAAELAFALALAGLAFVVVSGGDWMGDARFLAPLPVSMALAAFGGLEPWLPHTWGRWGLAGTLALANLGVNVQALHRGGGDSQPLTSVGPALRRFDAHVGRHEFSRVELLNKVHRRDAVVVSELLPILDALVPLVPGRRLTVMSGQAGMIAYHSVIRHFEEVQFLDLWSLTTRELYDCFPPGTVARGKWGTFIGSARPFQDHDILKRRCGLDLPDVMYGEVLEPHMPDQLRNYGYELLYHQVGSIKTTPGPSFFQGTKFADGYIAVKKELADRAGLQHIPQFRWNI